MDRKEYLELCRLNAMLPSGCSGIKINVPDGQKVVYGGILYYPVSYLLSYDKNGQTQHFAVLHDMKANSTIQVQLSKVEKFVQN